jgi:uncharacterized integral membrane protein (TIGR00698 family)
MFASLDAMEGAPAAARTTPPLSQTLRRLYPGVLATATIGLAASWLAQHYQTPVMLLALLLGMAFHFLHEDGRCTVGVEFVARRVLRLGVALLGARITLDQIMGLGPVPIVMVVAGVGTTILVGMMAARLLGQTRTFGVLSGGAVGICGASAALAIASVLPRTPESERDTILTVATVTILSTLAMILYPVLAVSLGLTDQQAGVFLGGTIHDVAQVVGAGYIISPHAGDVATYVKLLRVAMLAPVVFVLAMILAKSARGKGGRARAEFPVFLLGFIALVAVGSLGWVPKPLLDGAGEVSRLCLIAAMAALGMKTSFKKLAAVGWRPIGLMVLETVWIAVMVLIVVKLFV